MVSAPQPSHSPLKLHQYPALMDARFRHSEWLRRYDEGVKKKAKEDFVAHHIHRYSGRMPIWVATETWDFGLLYHLTTDEFARRRVYGSLCVMQHMLKIIEPDTQWPARIE